MLDLNFIHEVTGRERVLTYGRNVIYAAAEAPDIIETDSRCVLMAI